MSATIAAAAVSIALAAPPRVVSIEPAHGADFVDPARTELRVVFDQDMAAGMSWTGGGADFPAVTGRGHWISPRECVLPVALIADHRYNLMLNRGRFQNFRSAAGDVLPPTPLSFRTRPADVTMSPVPPRRANERSVAHVRDLIDRAYSYRDRLGIDWSARFDAAEADLINATSAFQFAARLGTVLRAADDPHLRVTDGADGVPVAVRSAPASFNPQVVMARLDDAAQPAPHVLTGRLAPDIAYVGIGSFSRGAADDVRAAIAHIDALDDAHTLVLDLRANGGGDELLARELAALFIDEPRVYARHESLVLDEPGARRFHPVSSRMIHPDEHGRRFGGRVIVLQGPVVLSSAEAFILMMRQAPRATTIGLPTGGSSGNPRTYDLANGVTVTLPSWRALRPDGTCFEGEGLAPEHPVKVADGAFAHGDPILDRALAVIADATDER